MTKTNLKNQQPRILRLEGLEDRCMLATFMVTNTNDAGDGSLRRAIQLSNATPGVDDVQFDAALTDQTITLTSGQIRISQAVTIDGQDRNVTIDASGSDPTPNVNDGMGSRVFQITDGAGDETPFFAELRNVTITGGDTDGNGGAIHSRQVLRLYDVTIRDSHATRAGGGFFATRALVRVEDSIISGNTAGESGGGVAYFAEIEYATSPVRFYRTQFLDNVANGAGGLFVRMDSIRDGGEIVVSECLFSENRGESFSGGMFASNYLSSAPIKIESSTFEDNTTNGNGGGLSIANFHRDSEIRDTVIRNNSANNGGGISMNASSGAAQEILVADSQITNNTASEDGGGILSAHDSRFYRSVISGNTAGNLGGGAAVEEYYSTAVFEQSTIENNSATRGGGVGMDSYGARVRLLMSSVIGNSASDA
ncbi:MAG: hypothetical protein AAF497_23380, partial [Planctomycetota bacterium]